MLFLVLRDRKKLNSRVRVANLFQKEVATVRVADFYKKVAIVRVGEFSARKNDRVRVGIFPAGKSIYT